MKHRHKCHEKLLSTSINPSKQGNLLPTKNYCLCNAAYLHIRPSFFQVDHFLWIIRHGSISTNSNSSFFTIYVHVALPLSMYTHQMHGQYHFQTHIRSFLSLCDQERTTTIYTAQIFFSNTFSFSLEYLFLSTFNASLQFIPHVSNY